MPKDGEAVLPGNLPPSALFPHGDDTGRSQSRLPDLDVEDIGAYSVTVSRGQHQGNVFVPRSGSGPPQGNSTSTAGSSAKCPAGSEATDCGDPSASVQRGNSRTHPRPAVSAPPKARAEGPGLRRSGSPRLGGRRPHGVLRVSLVREPHGRIGRRQLARGRPQGAAPYARGPRLPAIAPRPTAVTSPRAGRRVPPGHAPTGRTPHGKWMTTSSKAYGYRAWSCRDVHPAPSRPSHSSR